MSSKKPKSTSKSKFDFGRFILGIPSFSLRRPPTRQCDLGSHHTAPSSPFSPLIANRFNRLVLETLVPLPEDRKCFRMINGVLVERTVKDVVPALQTNADGLKKVLDDLVKQYKSKQEELEKWKVRESIHATPGPCSTQSDCDCRKRTTSRWCSHETASRGSK